MFRRTGRYSDEDLPQDEEGVLLPKERRPLQRPIISRPQSILEAAPDIEEDEPQAMQAPEPEEVEEAPAATPSLRPAAQSPQTVIAGDSVWDGALSSEGNVIIQGQAKGNIKARDSVSVEPGGSVNATITAKAVRISGSTKGKVNCEERLEVRRNGRIEGEFTTSILVIEEGAFVNGRFHMGDQRGSKGSERSGRNGDGSA
jgi:cytoskeletal protein CcmA (bactofilin family)